MSAGVKLLVYGVILVLVLGAGLALGSMTDPDPPGDDPTDPSDVHESDTHGAVP